MKKIKFRFFLTLIVILIAKSSFAKEGHLAYVFSIPKSGSHYLQKILTNLTNNKSQQVKHALPSQLSNYHVIEHFHQRPNGHMSTPKSTVDSSTRNHKKIILIRNLKDILISELRMCDAYPKLICWHFDHTCKLKPKIHHWKSYSETKKINYILNHCVIQKDIELCIKAIKKPKDTLVIRFEDLLTTSHGGNDANAISTIQKLEKHLNLPHTRDPIKLLKKSWGSSPTYIKGEKNHKLSNSANKLFTNSKWKIYNKQLGYN